MRSLLAVMFWLCVLSCLCRCGPEQLPACPQVPASEKSCRDWVFFWWDDPSPPAALLMDEPHNQYNQDAAAAQAAVSAAIDAALARGETRPLWVNLDAGDMVNIRRGLFTIDPRLNWVSLDEYRTQNPAMGWSSNPAPCELDELASYLRPGQRLALVPQAFRDANTLPAGVTTGGVDNWLDPVTVSDEYVRYAQSHDVVAVAPLGWSGGAGYLGASSMPEVAAIYAALPPPCP